VRMGYGFRNINNLIALVMLRCSNLPITLPGRV
jgi:transposase